MEVLHLNDIIKSSKNILITSHVNPDGDTLGSMCGMYELINTNFKKKSDMLIVSKLPDKYTFIPNVKLAKHIEEIDKSREYDLVINVDIAAIDRICDGKILFEKAKHTVNIDHHKTNNSYAELNFVEGDASSTSEVIYAIAKDLNWEINRDTAVCLYVGILTDTGSFRFSNTTPRAMEFAAEMLKSGINPQEMFQHCYETYTKGMALCQAYCVDKAVFLDDDKIVYTTVYKKDMEKFNTDEEFAEGLTERLRAITSTCVAFVAKEMKNGGCKISMRSKSIDVAEICGIFGGGGHKFAAGCTMKSNVEESVKKILAEIRKHEL